jgi:hypothetical protein
MSAAEQLDIQAEKQELLGILEDNIDESERKEVQTRLDEIIWEEESERFHKLTHGILDIVIENWDHFKPRPKFYPMCNYSNVWTMPKNAHPSYVKAAVISSS